MLTLLSAAPFFNRLTRPTSQKHTMSSSSSTATFLRNYGSTHLLRISSQVLGIYDSSGNTLSTLLTADSGATEITYVSDMTKYAVQISDGTTTLQTK